MTVSATPELLAPGVLVTATGLQREVGIVHGNVPTVPTNEAWTFDPDYLGKGLKLTSYVTQNNMSVQAKMPQKSIAIGLIEGAGSMYSYSNLIMFSVCVVTEDSQDVLLNLASVGIANLTVDLDTPLGSDRNSMAWRQNGSIFYNNVVQATGLPTFGSGDYLDMAFNLDAGLMWIRVNGNAWNGNLDADPAKMTGGHPMYINGTGTSGLTAVYPAVSPGSYNEATEIRIQQLTYDIPLNYMAL